MATSPELAPPGSSRYSSNTMTVGDGTWDTSRNTFLLPNLVGLNFDTMRYNGMGNRFRELPGYYNLVRAHGVIAAITFLLIVPSAILTLRFYGRNPRWALRYHVWLQILTVLLTTVVFVLGWFAVGPSRKLTNPHHGIGLAIYVLVLLQFIFGWWMSGREKKKRRLYEPLKVMLHHWLGRAIALLGIVQVALGLTLYGSPIALFVLYTLAVFTLLLIYFILTHRKERRYGSGDDYDSRYSYGTGNMADGRPDPRRRSGTGNLLKGALAGAGLYALADRFRSRRNSAGRHNNVGPEVIGSRRHSGSYLEDEKYSQYGRDPDRGSRWEDRLMKIAIPIGAAGLAARFLDRRHRDRDSDSGDFGPPLGGATAINEGRPGHYPAQGAPIPPGAPGPDGRPPMGPGPPGAPFPPGQPLPSGQHPLNRPLSQSSSMTYSSYESASHQPRRGHGLRDGIATLGVLGFAKSVFNRRKDRNNDQRFDGQQDTTMSGGRFTGDGRPPRQHHRTTSSIGSDSSLTGSHPHTAHGIPPIPAGTYAGGAAGAAALERERIERERRENEPLPLGGVYRPVSMPAMPPDPAGVLHREDTSGSESFASPGGRGHHRHHSGRNAAAAGIAGGAVGLMAGEALANRRQRDETLHQEEHLGAPPPPGTGPPRNTTGIGPPPGGPLSSHDPSNISPAGSGGAGPSAQTPPVSVKVRMHDNGRKVTLRRLPEEEARAEREARRAARSSRRRPGNGTNDDSISSLSGSDMGAGRPGQRFRRDDRRQEQNEEAMRVESERLREARAMAAQGPGQQGQKYQGVGGSGGGLSNVPAPPPIPETSPRPLPGGGGGGGSMLGSGVGSPGYDGGTSGGSDYAAQRRRRRAERAQGGGGQGRKTVGFE